MVGVAYSAKEMLRSVASLIREDSSRFVRLRVACSLFFIVAGAILAAATPVVLKWVVDGLSEGSGTGTRTITLLIMLYVVMQWLTRGLGEIRGLVYARAERRMLRTLTERMFFHIIRLPLVYHLDRRTGAIAQAVENGLQGYQMILHHVVFTFLPIGVQLLSIVWILVSLKQTTFLLLFGVALIGYAVAFGYTTARNSRIAGAASDAQVNSSATIIDCILAYETVKYFSAEATVRLRVNSALSKTETLWILFFKRCSISGLCVATIFALWLGSAMFYAAHELLAGRLTVGGFVLLNAYVIQVVQPLESVGYAAQGISQATAMLERMLAIFRESTEPDSEGLEVGRDCPNAVDCLVGREIQERRRAYRSSELEFRDVSLSYGAGRRILRHIDLKVGRGKTLGIVGPSGSGKSTIVRLVVRMCEPSGGRIYLDGAPIDQMPLSDLRRSISVVPQDTILFNDTIEYNIALGVAGCTREQVEKAARLAHLHDFIAGLPDGYETSVGERGVKLSGGEKQRIAIARAAIKRPSIFVFDEATSSLDSETEREILGNIKEIASTATTIVIAHRLSTVVHADEILVLQHGAIIERGCHDELLSRRGRYYSLWHAQSPCGVS